MLAGLLYAGSGVGLLVWSRFGRRDRGAPAEAPVRGAQWLWLGLAVAFGGVAAPGL